VAGEPDSPPVLSGTLWLTAAARVAPFALLSVMALRAIARRNGELLLPLAPLMN
jgi:hypothetical protein